MRFPSERVFVRFKNLDEHHAGAFAAEVRGAPSLPQSCRRVNADSREPKHAGQVRNCSHSCDNALVVRGWDSFEPSKRLVAVSVERVVEGDPSCEPETVNSVRAHRASGSSDWRGAVPRAVHGEPPAGIDAQRCLTASQILVEGSQTRPGSRTPAAFTASSVGRKGELQRMRQHPEFR